MITYFVLLSVPALVGGIYFYNNAVSSVKNESFEMVNQRLFQERNSVISKLAEFEAVVDKVSKNTSIQTTVTELVNDDANFILNINNNINPFSEWILVTNPGISSMRYYTYNKSIQSYYLFKMAEKYENTNWFKTAKQQLKYGYPYWEEYHNARNFIGKKTVGNVFSLFYPITLYPKTSDAYIEMEIKPSYLFEHMNKTPIFDTGYFFAVNDKGDIIYGDNSNINQEISKFSLKNNNKSTDMHVKIDEVEYNVCVADISKINSKLISVVPSIEITKSIGKARNTFILSLLGIIVLLSAFCYLLAYLLLKKLKNIVKVVRKIQNEDFDIYIPVKGNDEIDELANDINIMSDRINNLINKVYKSEIMQKEAKLCALQAQINPHFMYNTLETIKMMAQIKEEYEISDVLTSFGSLLRYNISLQGKYVMLEQEIRNLRDYLDIQKLLLNNKLYANLNIQPETLKCKVPKLIIQPLVENCILHGYKNRVNELKLQINCFYFDDELLIIIEDNGDGIKIERLLEIQNALNNWKNDSTLNSESGNGIALTNINKRIKLEYGEKYGVSISNRKCGGTNVTIKIKVDNTLFLQ